VSPLSFRSSAFCVFNAFAAACVLFIPAMAGADTPIAAPQTAEPATAAAAKKVGSRTLRSGDHGPRVAALQTLLTQAGFKTSTDGSFGESTATVVRRFQRAANLGATGVADRKTILALKGATDGSAARNASGGFDVRSTAVRSRSLGDRIPLRKGMSGHDVKVLQDYLKRAGFTTSVDGEYGAGTVRTVKKFETDQQVATDGVTDAADIDLLRSLVDGDAATGTGSTTPRTVALTPGSKSTVGSDGLAVAPADAPDQVKQIIAAGNEIAKTPYVYGGGHGKWQDRGYDCSGSVSYALHGGGLLSSAMPSGNFTGWGDKGPGQWVTIYAKSSHMYMVVAGLRFDTSGRSKGGSRWQTAPRSNRGFKIRHPLGL
jgi:peptidoglycan hydrolase-like protein with peptidoglycan-binding domain